MSLKEIFYELREQYEEALGEYIIAKATYDELLNRYQNGDSSVSLMK